MMPSLGAGRTRRFIHPSAWKEEFSEVHIQDPV
jgi:hypothetical protein